MKTTKLVLLAIIMLMAFSSAYSQDTNTDSHTISIGIPKVALLDIESATGKNISLQGTAPTEAGEMVNFNATNSSLWLNYTSIKSTANPSRNVSVQITAGTVPAGLQLTVQAGSFSGSGVGTFGTSAGVITLTGTAQNLLTGIGSAYTGNGPSNGHNLTYTLSQVGSYAALDFDNSNTLTVTYTLSDI
ncbi:MAG: hypothetical protein KGZ87_02625 [Bacteroidetes bacterium]|jgi:hypothetical protein|nr:hypothetical protein [Bacteroidota bacterium]